MGKLKKAVKAGFNHGAETVLEAVGLEEGVGIKFKAFGERIFEEKPETTSKIVEMLDNSFSKRELAFILGQKLVEQLVEMNEESPLEALLRRMKGGE